MKNLFAVLAFFLFIEGTPAQNIGINANGANPHPSAMLDIDVSAVTGTKRGLLIPRMTSLERDAIPFPALSLFIFNTTDNCYEYFKGVGFGWSGCLQEKKNCPAGFVSVNLNYCIEINERTDVQIFVANDTCMSRNARLCTWGEWHYACLKAGVLSLQNMTNNWEWVDDIVNENASVVVGDNGNCENMWNRGLENAHSYRCCFSK